MLQIGRSAPAIRCREIDNDFCGLRDVGGTFAIWAIRRPAVPASPGPGLVVMRSTATIEAAIAAIATNATESPSCRHTLDLDQLIFSVDF